MPIQVNRENIGFGATKESITEFLEKLSQVVGFSPIREVNTGFSKVDLVWFDRRIEPFWMTRSKHLETSLAVPVVGFEIEERSLTRKAIRGDIGSLNSLSPQLGVLILSSMARTVSSYRDSLRYYTKKRKMNPKDRETRRKAMDKAMRDWTTSMQTFGKFADASPRTRISIWTDEYLLTLGEKYDIELKLDMGEKI